MSRWEELDPRRLRHQEQALLALCDRMTILERALTAEIDAHQMTRKRIDRLEREHASLLRILGRET